MSGGYGEPDWATPGNTDAVTTTQNAATGGAITAPITTSDGSSTRAKLLLVLLSCLDIGVATMMAALGVLALLEFNGISADDYSEAFLSVYMIIFAFLLFLYELMWWQGIPFINKALRRNFGFMYGLKGKGFYMIFIAFLTIGLENESSLKALRWATGIALLGIGVLHLFLVMVNPELIEIYKPPTSGLTASAGAAGEEGSAPV